MSGAITAQGIAIEREIAATPDAVFGAWTSPTAFAEWFGGPQVSVPPELLDFQAEAGRSWSATMELPNGARIVWAGEFVAVDPHTRLEFTLTDQPAAAERAVITVDLAPGVTGTQLRFTQTTPGFSAEQRAGVLAGWEGFMDALQVIAER